MSSLSRPATRSGKGGSWQTNFIAGYQQDARAPPAPERHSRHGRHELRIFLLESDQTISFAAGLKPGGGLLHHFAGPPLRRRDGTELGQLTARCKAMMQSRQARRSMTIFDDYTRDRWLAVSLLASSLALLAGASSRLRGVQQREGLNMRNLQPVSPRRSARSSSARFRKCDRCHPSSRGRYGASSDGYGTMPADP